MIRWATSRLAVATSPFGQKLAFSVVGVCPRGAGMLVEVVNAIGPYLYD